MNHEPNTAIHSSSEKVNNDNNSIILDDKPKDVQTNKPEPHPLKDSIIMESKLSPNEKNDKQDKVILYPRLILSYHISQLDEQFDFAQISKNFGNPDNTIFITPNSINGSMKKIGEKFNFGKVDPKSQRVNDFNFKDDTIGVRQFEIKFDQGT